MVGGDFNARHTSYGDVSLNSYGQILFNIANTHDLQIKNPPSPTCYRSADGSFIDKFILSGSSRQIGSSNVVNIPSFSDHTDISIELLINITRENQPVPSFKNFAMTNIVGLNRFIENQITKITIPTNENITNSQIDVIAENIETICTCAIEKYVPNTFTKNGNYLSSASRKIVNGIQKTPKTAFPWWTLVKYTIS